MKVDLHVHTKERSPCAESGEEELIRAAIHEGMDALAFTDHNRLAPPERLAILNEKYAPFQVFGGIEISIGFEDYLVLGMQDEILEKRRWYYDELRAFVRERGGFIALAHPYRFHNVIGHKIKEDPPDALEICSTNTADAVKGRILELAEQLDIPLLCNSDSHSSDSIGDYYNILNREPADDMELVSILTSRDFRCGCLNNKTGENEG